MTEADLNRLLVLVGAREDEVGALTRKLLGDYIMTLAQSGDVDVDGEIIDRALLRRLRQAIGNHAANLDPPTQLHLTLAYYLEGRRHLEGVS